MIAILSFNFVISTLLIDKTVAFSSSLCRNCDSHRRIGAQSYSSSPRYRPVLFLTLDRDFVTNVYKQCSPSVALVIPRGVRNTTAQGSGFVIAIDDERYILTSAHVAAGGMTVEVALPSDNYALRYNASVIGRAPNGEDIALLALNDATVATSLIPLEFGDSNVLHPGCFVIAMGHPSGLRGAVTLGVLSGRLDLPVFDSMSGTTSNEEEDTVANCTMVPYLVTDAAFAGGMSGGPLCGEDGKVYGVNTLVDGRLRGLGNLAIGSDRALQVVKSIVSKSKAETQNACRAIRLVLFNDRFNTRARVLSVLLNAGLSEEKANAVMMDAHKTGRGVVQIFETQAADGTEVSQGAGDLVEKAERLRSDLLAADLLVELERVF